MRPKRTLRVSLLAAVVGLVVVSILLPWLDPRFLAPRVLSLCLVASLSLLVIAVGVYFVVSFSSYTRPDEFPEGHREDDTRSIDDELVDMMVSQSGYAHVPEEHLFAFAGFVLRPSGYFTRISEHVESYHRSTLVRTTFTIRFRELHDVYVRLGSSTPRIKDRPEDERTREVEGAWDWVVPLWLPPKDVLQDGLRVEASGGRRVSTIDGATLGAYSAAVLRYLLQLSSPATLSAYLTDDRKIERAAWKVLSTSSPADPSEVAEVERLVTGLPSDDAQLDYRRDAANLIVELAERRAISVAVPSEDVAKGGFPSTTRITLSRRFIGASAAAPDARFRDNPFLDSVRLALGVRLHRVYFPLTAAYRTPSYHLEVEGQEGTYFAGGDINIPPLQSGEVIQFGGVQQARKGQRRAHLYLTGMTGDQTAYFFARFFERAPGSLASTSIAAIASAVLISALVLISTSFDSAVRDQARYLIPVLVALPVALAAFIGIESSGVRRHPSLLSRGITFGIAATSLAGFLMAVGNGGLTDGAVFWWHLLFWGSWALAATSIFSWALRLAVEHHFMSDTEHR